MLERLPLLGGLALLAIASMVTVVQRILFVRRQAFAALEEERARA